MNNSPQTRFLWTFTEVVTRIGEIALWIASVMMIVLLIVSYIKAADLLSGIVRLSDPSFFRGLDVMGLTIGTGSTDPAVCLLVLRFWSVAGIIGFGLVAMMFRNTRLILKTIQGKTSFCEGETPFQKPVVRMVREIGIFLILLPVLQLTVQEAAFLMIPECNVSVTLIYIFLGLLMLCLSQCFERGITLEKETEGLI